MKAARCCCECAQRAEQWRTSGTPTSASHLLAGGSGTPTSDAADETPLRPGRAELARFGRLKTLRSLLQRLVTQHGGQGASAPPLAFERWLARAALRRAAEADPVLPAAAGVDAQLVADLSRSLPRDKAVIIAEALSARSRDDAARQAAVFSDAAAEPVPEAATRRLVKAVRRAGKPLPTDAAAWAALATAAEALAAHARSRAEVRPTYTVAVDRDGPNVRLAAMDGDAPKKPYVLISHDHYAKLTTLHARYGAGGRRAHFLCRDALRGAAGRRISGLGPASSRCLPSSVRRRDSSLATQCAVPGACFESLREFLGNTIECFASPLNCRFERYFSAFPALERAFGSLGSFFDEWHRIEAGSFEVNPPFVPEVLAFAAAKVGELLGDGAKGALSFLAVVPDWGGGTSTFCHRRHPYARAGAAAVGGGALRESPFLRANVTIPAAEHVFVDGAQHRVRDRHRPSSWDTGSSPVADASAGCAKWPLDTKTLARARGRRSVVRRTRPRPRERRIACAGEKRGPGRGGKKRPRSAPPKRKTRICLLYSTRSGSHLWGVGGGVGRCEGGARTAALSNLSDTASSTRVAKTEDADLAPVQFKERGRARHLA